MEELIVYLVVWTIFGVICALIGQHRGRSGLAWFFIGFFLQIIGLILVLVLANLKKEEARQLQFQRENRRLRERLHKDRQTSDQRHSQVHHRLGLHDQTLDIDTSQRLESHTGPEYLEHTETRPPPPNRPPKFRRPPKPKKSEEVWFYNDNNGQEQGPVSKDRLLSLLLSGQIGPGTQVWRAPWKEWRVLAEVEDLNYG